MKRASNLTILVLVCFFVLLLCAPFLIINYYDIAIVVPNQIKLQDFITFFISVISICVTIILGIIVYFQSEHINHLEASQFDVFVGIETLESTLELGENYFFQFASSNSFAVSQTIVGDEVQYLTYLPIDYSQGKDESKMVIPFIFVTKNRPLITNITLEKLAISLHNKDCKTIAKEFTGKHGENNISKLMENSSRLSFGIIMSSIPNLNALTQVNIDFFVTVSDQLSRLHKLQISAICSYLNNKFYLLSTQTIRVE